MYFSRFFKLERGILSASSPRVVFIFFQCQVPALTTPSPRGQRPQMQSTEKERAKQAKQKRIATPFAKVQLAAEKRSEKTEKTSKKKTK